MNYDVTVIGEIYQDHIFSGFPEWPRPGEEIFTDAYTWELGGGAVTTACALARLGRKVQLIGIVGAREFELVEGRLAQFGVSAEHIVQSNSRSGITVSISTQQDRTFFTYRGANAELEEFLHKRGEAVRLASKSRHVHLAFPLSSQLGHELLPALQDSGATISLDVGHDVEWLNREKVLEVLRAVDFLLPNEKEAALLCGSAEKYLEFCHEQSVAYAVVKLGPSGAVMITDNREFHASSPAVHVVDTTGAGDAFDAGFIDALLSRMPWSDCLEHACVCGALSTRAAGSLMALPTRGEAETVRGAKHVS